MEYLSDGPLLDYLLALPQNIKPGWKGLSGTNTLAYFTSLSVRKGIAMFVERKVCSSALFTNLVGWHAGAVSLPRVMSFGPS